MTAPVPTGPTSSGHLAINGLQLYHEVYGDLAEPARVPLLLLPGAFMAIDSMAATAGTRW